MSAITILESGMEEFLFSYSYLTEAEYDNTEKRLLKMLSSGFNSNKINRR